MKLLLAYCFTAALSAIAGVPALALASPPLSRNGTLNYELCDSAAAYSIDAELIELTPYPIRSQEPISIRLVGTLREEVKAGAMTQVAVKVGFITKHIDIDICKETAKNQLPCPIQPGRHSITLGMDVPWTPVGGINVVMTATAKNADQSTMFCFRSTVTVVKGARLSRL